MQGMTFPVIEQQGLLQIKPNNVIDYGLENENFDNFLSGPSSVFTPPAGIALRRIGLCCLCILSPLHSR
jgi:hypothetical protein